MNSNYTNLQPKLSKKIIITFGVPSFGTMADYLCIKKMNKPIKNKNMNTDLILNDISAMFPSETSYRTFVDMFNDMDLELTDISLS